MHFDINGTLYAADPHNNGKTAHDVISTFIAEKYLGKWDETLEKPICFYDYVKFNLCPNPDNDLAIKNAQNVFYSRVLEEFKERGYPQLATAQNDYDKAMAAQKKQEEKHNTIVVRSFF